MLHKSDAALDIGSEVQAKIDLSTTNSYYQKDTP